MSRNIVSFISKNPYATTRQITRHMGSSFSKVIDELVKLKRAKVVDSRIKIADDGFDRPEAIWWINNGPKV